MPRTPPKVLAAMSGGVDSSVAAALLQRQGYEVVGCFMRLGDAPAGRNGHQGCCSINDAADARLVAATLGIPFYVCNFKRDFGRIIDYFVGEYNAGRTPNPCVRCNDWLKFGKLHEYARQVGAAYVASGHYARIVDGRLLRAVDRDKDQSYVLFGTPAGRLGSMLLPLGGLRKPEVRRLARELGLPVHDKPESQEICFVPDNDYAALVRRQAPQRVESGAIVDAAGRVLGRHGGHQHFTIGQRRGLGVAAGRPLYVVDKNAATNTVTVGPRRQLLADGCRAAETNWFVPDRGGAWIDCGSRIRYNADAVPSRVRRLADGGLEVRFGEPQFAVAPGQAVVCYDGDAVLCGGWITERL